jgi:hypothetical protein
MFDPFEVYERLFTGDLGMSEAAVLARLQQASILDGVLDEYAAALPWVSGTDRIKLQEHFERIREIETALDDMPVTACDPGAAPPALQHSSENFEQLGQLMIDLAVMALSCDLTRVVGLQFSEPLARNSFPFLNLPDYHHAYQHDAGYSPTELAVIELWYMELFASLLQKLATTTDACGSLLDSMAVYNTTEISHSGDHGLTSIPVLLLGNLAGRIRSGRVLRYGSRHYNDILVSIQNAFGIESEVFGAPDFVNGPLPGFV